MKKMKTPNSAAAIVAAALCSLLDDTPDIPQPIRNPFMGPGGGTQLELRPSSTSLEHSPGGWLFLCTEHVTFPKQKHSISVDNNAVSEQREEKKDKIKFKNYLLQQKVESEFAKPLLLDLNIASLVTSGVKCSGHVTYHCCWWDLTDLPDSKHSGRLYSDI